MANFLADTYALVEILKGSPNYKNHSRRSLYEDQRHYHVRFPTCTPFPQADSDRRGEKELDGRWMPIRLNEERWLHITEEHSEMAGYYFEVLETVEEPEAIYEGKTGELIAVKEMEKGKYIAVIYRESEKEDGFVITAFLTRRRKQFERRREVWSQLQK